MMHETHRNTRTSLAENGLADNGTAITAVAIGLVAGGVREHIPNRNIANDLGGVPKVGIVPNWSRCFGHWRFCSLGLWHTAGEEGRMIFAQPASNP